MTFQYIAGFFDADGYITMSREYAGRKVRIPIIGFSNNVREILEEFADFIHNELGINGFISTKKARKDNHSDSYTLAYNHNPKVQALIPKLMEYSRHPKKINRMQLIRDKLPTLTHRQGKYSNEMLKARQQLEEQILSIK